MIPHKDAPPPTVVDRWIMVGPACILIAFAAMAGVVGLGAIINGDIDERSGQLIGACCVGIGLSCVALGAGWVWRKERMRPAMVIAIVLAAVAWCLWTWLIKHSQGPWTQSQEQATFFATLMTTIAVGLTYTGVFVCLKTKSFPLRILKLSNIALIWLLGAMFCVLTAVEAFSLMPGWWIMNVLGAVQVCAPLLLIGSVVTPLAISSDARRKAAQHESVVARPTLKLDCPQCQAALECMSGPARCDECGFTMAIELEEPRCECGYLLYKLQGHTCPECGRGIAQAQLARAPSDPLSSQEVVG